MENKIRLTLWLFLSLIFWLSCSEEPIHNFASIDDTVFKPTTSTATNLNDGWVEVLLKDEEQEIIIYLSSLAEGSYKFVPNTSQPFAKDYAVAMVTRGDKIFTAQSGELKVSNISELEASFNFIAQYYNRSSNKFEEIKVERGKFSHLPLTPLTPDDCLLVKTTDGGTSTQFVYDSEKKVVFVIANSYLQVFKYYQGVVWPSTLSAQGRVDCYLERNNCYKYNEKGNVIKTYCFDCPRSEVNAEYDSEGNITKQSSYTGTNSPVVTSVEYLQYDNKKNPFALLAKSFGGYVYKVYSVNNAINALRVPAYQISYPPHPVALNETNMHEYNPAGYPVKTVTSPSGHVITYEYLCK